MWKIVASGFAGCMLLGAASNAAGEQADSKTVGFASAGLGAGSKGIAGVISMNFSRGSLYYGARMSSTAEFDIFGPTPALSDTDFALLVGRSGRSGHGFVSASTGIALAHSVRRGTLIEQGYWFAASKYESLDRTTVGLPIDLKAVAHAGVIGIGVNVFGDLNMRTSFGGVTLTLQLGTFH